MSYNRQKVDYSKYVPARYRRSVKFKQEEKKQESDEPKIKTPLKRIHTHRELMLKSHSRIMKTSSIQLHTVELVIGQIEEWQPLSQDFFTLAWRADSSKIFEALMKTCRQGMGLPKTHRFWQWYNDYVKNSSVLVEVSPENQTERVHQALSRLAAQMSRTAKTVRNLFDATSTTQRHLYNLPHSQFIEIEAILSRKFDRVSNFNQFVSICETWSPDLKQTFARAISEMIVDQNDPYMLLRIALGTVPFDVLSEDIIAIIVSFLDNGSIVRNARINKAFLFARKTNEKIIDTHVEIPIRDRAIHVYAVKWDKRREMKLVKFETVAPRSYTRRRQNDTWEKDLPGVLNHLDGVKSVRIVLHLFKYSQCENEFLVNEILPRLKCDIVFNVHFARADPQNSDKSRRNDPMLTNPPSPYDVCPGRLQYLVNACTSASRIIFTYTLYKIRLCRDDPYSDLDDTYNKIQNHLVLPGMAITLAYPREIRHVTWDFQCSQPFSACTDELVTYMHGVPTEEIIARLAHFDSVEIRGSFVAQARRMEAEFVRWFSCFPEFTRLHLDSFAPLGNTQVRRHIPKSIREFEIEIDRRFEWTREIHERLNEFLPNVTHLTLTYGRQDFYGNPMELMKKLMLDFPLMPNMNRLTINICRPDLGRETKVKYDYNIRDFDGILNLDPNVRICVRFLHIPFVKIHRGVYVEDAKRNPLYPQNVAVFQEFLGLFFQRYDFEMIDDPADTGSRYHWARTSSYQN